MENESEIFLFYPEEKEQIENLMKCVEFWPEFQFEFFKSQSKMLNRILKNSKEKLLELTSLSCA